MGWSENMFWALDGSWKWSGTKWNSRPKKIVVCKRVGEVGAIILVCRTCPGVVGKLVKLGPEVEVVPKNRKNFISFLDSVGCVNV